ncbi:hypothetical protein [uncultured Aquimarina sp.]|uniref:hypothetical protein n=1 Tax=uncultured Aquimarina sp. TaxID=575652 RepID=UPI0026299BCC|nr:hypothetical protein [uncultured Aquimarina sp.]
MGYNLSIQRENKDKISKQEWKSYINSDSEFTAKDEYSGNLPDGKIVTIPTPNAGIWEFNNREVPFTFSEEYGWISVKNPENWIIKKMISIANELDAVVLGEEGEKYDEEYLNKENKLTSNLGDKKWWEFWK